MESLSTLNPLDENEITHNIIDLFKAPLETVKLGLEFSFLWVQFLWPVPESLDAVLSLLSRPRALRGDRPILPAFLPLLLSTISGPRNSTEAVADWGVGQACSQLYAQLLILWRPEGKILQKWSKENKQLSSGQLFSKAHPLSWKTKVGHELPAQVVTVSQGLKSCTMS